jgi:hypothetical protein
MGQITAEREALIPMQEECITAIPSRRSYLISNSTLVPSLCGRQSPLFYQCEIFKQNGGIVFNRIRGILGKSRKELER